MHASTPLILRKSRMRRRARTDLCGGRSATVVPTATLIPLIAGEFYPNGNAACSELAEASSPSNEEDEVIARICELTHQLGYNQAKTKMLLGQWAGNLAGLERKLLNELGEVPERDSAYGFEGTNRKRAPNERQQDISREVNPEKPLTPAASKEGDFSKGFLF